MGIHITHLDLLRPHGYHVPLAHQSYTHLRHILQVIMQGQSSIWMGIDLQPRLDMFSYSFGRGTAAHGSTSEEDITPCTCGTADTLCNYPGLGGQHHLDIILNMLCIVVQQYILCTLSYVNSHYLHRID